MGNYKRYETILQPTTTFGVPPFLHIVAPNRNTIVGWIPEMANVLVENNGVWHSALVAPIKLVDALGP